MKKLKVTLSARVRRRIAAGLMIGVTSMSALAAEHVPLVAGPDLQLPSLWRVMLGFVLAIGLAVAAIMLLRKIRPLMPSAALLKGSAVTLVGQRQLARNLTVHIIEVDKQRYMVVNSAHSTVLALLDKEPV